MIQNNFDFKTKHTVVQAYSNGEEITAVRIDDPRFKDVVVQFGRISFDNLEDAENAEEIVLNFDYDIIDNKGLEFDISEFEQYIGDVLQDIIAFELQRKTLGEVLANREV